MNAFWLRQQRGLKRRQREARRVFEGVPTFVLPLEDDTGVPCRSYFPGVVRPGTALRTWVAVHAIGVAAHPELSKTTASSQDDVPACRGTHGGFCNELRGSVEARRARRKAASPGLDVRGRSALR